MNLPLILFWGIYFFQYVMPCSVEDFQMLENSDLHSIFHYTTAPANLFDIL